jgi:hypothetical protein
MGLGLGVVLGEVDASFHRLRRYGYSYLTLEELLQDLVVPLRYSVEGLVDVDTEVVTDDDILVDTTTDSDVKVTVKGVVNFDADLDLLAHPILDYVVGILDSFAPHKGDEVLHVGFHVGAGGKGSLGFFDVTHRFQRGVIDVLDAGLGIDQVVLRGGLGGDRVSHVGKGLGVVVISHVY